MRIGLAFPLRMCKFGCVDAVQYDTPARKKLKTWVTALGLNQKQIADALAPIVRPSMLSRWMSGKSRPDWLGQEILFLVTEREITCSDWLTPEERDKAAGCTRQARRTLKTGRRNGRNGKSGS
jgi:hypothetical protein